ncbi:hypothetical protein HOY82DRAFT_580853 [Tuber indicum]|nr:hypothetical protein HOY82DRAFT_580853 [Tuber indicum]
MAPRGRGGKFGKPTRGGGKHFSRNLAPLDNDDGESIPEGMWGEPRDPKPEIPSSEDEDEEEEEGEEGEGEDADKPELTREERRAAKQARKEAARAKSTTTVGQSSLPSSGDEDEEITTPAVEKTRRSVIATANPNAPGSSDGEAAAAKEKFWKLQEAGKTDQARADLARLAVIRKEREEKARQRKAELEERKAAAEAKAAASGRKK